MTPEQLAITILLLIIIIYETSSTPARPLYIEIGKQQRTARTLRGAY